MQLLKSNLLILPLLICWWLLVFFFLFPRDRAISRRSHISWMLSKWQTRVSYLRNSTFLSRAKSSRLLRFYCKALRILHFLESQEKVVVLSTTGVIQLVAGSIICLLRWNPKICRNPTCQHKNLKVSSMMHSPISGQHGGGFESPHSSTEHTQKQHRYSVSVKLSW